MFTIKVGEILGKEQGTRQAFALEGKLEPPENTFRPASHFTAKVELLRISEGVHVLLQDSKIKVNFACHRCAEPFVQEINIPAIERVFYEDTPSSAGDDEELNFINMKDRTIDLAPMIQEEILLHLPLIQVCSKSCKGLCHKCGQNLNKGTCSCPPETKKENKPLSVLKVLKDKF